MSAIDTAGLLILAWAAIGYISKSQKPEVPQVPTQEGEVDVSRWRHDGSQPLVWTKGNGASFVDHTASYMFDKIS